LKAGVKIALIALGLAAAGCEDGDWLGSLEREVRAGVNGFDMWATDAVRPYEDPMPPRVEGTVPTTGRYSFEAGAREVATLPPDRRAQRGALVYRRFCHHCHGPDGDGRIIVGESLEVRPADLRAPAVQSQTDRQLYEHVTGGGRLMLPLAQTIAPADILLALRHVRALRGAPSRPHFEPQRTRPIR
jgi:mono/diheme cytochrome c family protein